MSSPDPSSQTLDLIDTALDWFVLDSRRGSGVRHLVDDDLSRALCRTPGDGNILTAAEVGAHRACRRCLKGDVSRARLAPIDFSEVEPPFRVDSFDAVFGAIQRLAELSAWVNFPGTARHLQGMAEEWASVMADHHRNWWKRWADAPTVEHPLGDLEQDERER